MSFPKRWTCSCSSTPHCRYTQDKREVWTKVGRVTYHRKVYDGGAYHLIDHQGLRPIPPINGRYLKKYFTWPRSRVTLPHCCFYVAFFEHFFFIGRKGVLNWMDIHVQYQKASPIYVIKLNPLVAAARGCVPGQGTSQLTQLVVKWLQHKAHGLHRQGIKRGVESRPMLTLKVVDPLRRLLLSRLRGMQNL